MLRILYHLHKQLKQDFFLNAFDSVNHKKDQAFSCLELDVNQRDGAHHDKVAINFE